MTARDVVIVGTGGLARELTAWLGGNPDYSIRGYITQNEQEFDQYQLPGELRDEDAPQGCAALIAVGDPPDKEKIFHRMKARGWSFATFVHRSAVVGDHVRVEEGAIVGPHSVIGSRAALGRSAYVNFCCGIGHEAQVGDFVQINPGSQIGGGCSILRGALIGSGATVLELTTIGEGATIASGSVVFSNVSAGATVLGNPAKRMRALEVTPDQ